MANSENDVIRDAIIGTEKEIFGDAFGQDDVTLDETGDRSLEAMGDGLEGQHEPEEDDDETDGEEAPDEGKAEQEAKAPEGTETAEQAEARKQAEARQQDQHGRVPPGRLREEAEARRAAETERDTLKQRLDQMEANHQRALSESNARFEAMMVALQRGQQPQQGQPPLKPEGPPDIFEDPKGFAEYVEKRADARVAAYEQQMRAQHINTSMESAKERHGATFDAAFTALRSLDANNPDNRAFVQRLTSAPNPGEAVVAWHKRNETLRRIGNDPDAYERQIAERQREALLKDPEVVKQILASARQQAATGDEGQPRTAYRLPPSLGRQAGGNIRAPSDLDQFDGSPDAIFQSAFS